MQKPQVHHEPATPGNRQANTPGKHSRSISSLRLQATDRQTLQANTPSPSRACGNRQDKHSKLQVHHEPVTPGNRQDKHSNLAEARRFNQFGRSPPSQSVRRKSHTIAVGTEIREWYPAPHSQWFHGTVTRKATAARPKYQIKYVEDGNTIEYDELEVRNWIDVRKFPQWTTAVNAVKEAFVYLENRITDNCQTPYHCSGPYEVCRVSQLFDPSFAVVNLSPNFVDELCAAVPALGNAAAALKAEVEAYRVEARSAPAMDHSDVQAFTEAILEFWRKHGNMA